MNPTETQRSHLELSPVEFCLEPAAQFVSAFAAGLGMVEERREAIGRAARAAMKMVLEKNADGRSDQRIGVDVFESEGKLHVEVLNRGVPIVLDPKTGDLGPFHEVASGLDRLSIENRGRSGQTVSLAIRLGEEAMRRTASEREVESPLPMALEGLEIRELRPGEEGKLSQLFYSVYGYDYINEFVYYPDQIRARVEDGRLISVVAALPDGRLLGHVGLYKWNDAPLVYEPCLGVSHPQVKAKGLFSSIFAATMARLGSTGYSYAFFDFVTNHVRSQRMVDRYNPCPLSIFVGCQSKQTQARLEKLGIGQDPKETDRYSLLYSVIPGVSHPFGHQITLPANLGESVGFLLEPLNLTWSPASRFDALPRHGEYQTHLQPAQQAVVFDVSVPGESAVEGILGDWTDLLKNGYQYAGVEVPLDAPGIGTLYAQLVEHGFFIAGFIPYKFTGRLGFRFQAMGPTKVDFDEIQVSTPTARRLLDVIRDNCERTQLL